MTTLAHLNTQVLQLLADPAGIRYPGELVTEAIRQALQEYSTAWPQVKVAGLTVTQPGQAQSLAGLAGLQAVLRLVYPYTPGEIDPPPWAAYWYYWADGRPVVQIQGASPQAGQQLQVTYAAAHSLQDLDGAPLTTVRPDHLPILATGAAGLAAVMRASGVAESYASRSSDPSQLLEWGGAQLLEFRSRLRELKITARQMPGVLPAAGWTLDRWDRRLGDE
ncbi:MAG: hypothetical protein VB089_06100 [Anaerolineaceae bacterium]|nr:hypothetical protein [Anaerolineaceae bacterium]